MRCISEFRDDLGALIDDHADAAFFPKLEGTTRDHCPQCSSYAVLSYVYWLFSDIIHEEFPSARCPVQLGVQGFS